jgi:NAD+ synthase
MIDRDPLKLDAAAETDRIAEVIREQVLRTLRRRGVVLGLSGGVDSTVAAALCVRALGSHRVLGVLMPEADSAPESLTLGQSAGTSLGIRTIVEDVTPILEASGCYTRRDAAIASVVPSFRQGYRSKIVRATDLEDDRYPVFHVVVEFPDGQQTSTRLTADAHLAILAATSFKQRVRKMVEYHYADRHQYAVVGTANRLEQDQGFFVKNGDGAADLKPIAHLYKTQIYQLAEFLELPQDIRHRPPTTDTFSLPQSQEEFYFSVPYQVLDLCLWGVNHQVPATEVASLAGVSPAHAERIYKDIELKRRTTVYAHSAPLLVPDQSSIATSTHAR